MTASITSETDFVGHRRSMILGLGLALGTAMLAAIASMALAGSAAAERVGPTAVCMQEL